MAFLVDTNILLRSIQPAYLFYERAVRAVETLLQQGETVYFLPTKCAGVLECLYTSCRE